MCLYFAHVGIIFASGNQNNWTMSKKKMSETKRKAALAERTKVDAFKFQVEWQLKKVLPNLSMDNAALQAEIDTIVKRDWVKGLNDLAEIIKGVKQDLIASPVEDKNSLNGSIIAYIYGITTINPVNDDGTLKAEDPITKAPEDENDRMLRVDLYYDNEVWMKVGDWAKEHGYESIIMAYHPVIKLQNVRVNIHRIKPE